MADTYAVVQKLGAPAGAGGREPARSADADAQANGEALYSQVTPRDRRPRAPGEDARRALPESVPADQTPVGPSTYEDVANGAQTGGLGFNLRIGKPKGPRDPPAEWTRV